MPTSVAGTTRNGWLRTRAPPALSRAGLKPSHAVIAVDEFGQTREGHIAGEQPLTLYLNKREVVTLMTLGTHPELLVLGYLRNQRLVSDLASVRSVQVDWETDACAVTTFEAVGDLDAKLERRTRQQRLRQGLSCSAALAIGSTSYGCRP